MSEMFRINEVEGFGERWLYCVSHEKSYHIRKDHAVRLIKAIFATLPDKELIDLAKTLIKDYTEVENAVYEQVIDSLDGCTLQDLLNERRC